MDHNFTKIIGDWLNKPESERDYSVGAIYLLKLSGNKILYNNIVANLSRRHKDVEYHLQKYYNFRLRQLTHEQVVAMQAHVEEIVNKQIPLAANADVAKQHRGKRDDHEQLPDEIKALYVENLSLLQRMRELHLKLRSLSLENVTCPDSERYPFLKEIISLDKKLHSNWEQYDHYIPTAPTATAAAKPKKTASRRKSTTKKKSDK